MGNRWAELAKFLPGKFTVSVAVVVVTVIIAIIAIISIIVTIIAIFVITGFALTKAVTLIVEPTHPLAEGVMV